ncbi:MAG: DUF6600 domain-containing protein [Thiobacillaceae bacterium]
MKHVPAFVLFPLLILLALCGNVVSADTEEAAGTPTPPRLSYLEGPASYWQPGEQDWANASVNLPLAVGDSLYTGNASTLELQIGSRSFIRASENSELTLMNQDEHFIQVEVTSGLVSFDIRSITEGDTIEVDTPRAVFTIEQPGYFRLEVAADTIHFITHRSGRATVTTADGRSMSIYPSEDIVVSGDNPVMVETYAAPARDAWDTWNHERSESVTESVSSRYLPPDIWGAEALDPYGQWRVVPEYGAVWIPNDVEPDWVPYSTGNWIVDPNYGWTWVDDAPWGWAPFHYGRWVSVNGIWCWAPGSVSHRALYAPALVGFMTRKPDLAARLGAGEPTLSWVPLGWGEPVLPWWGPQDYRGHPHWLGWGGPRVAFNGAAYHFRNADLPRGVLTAPLQTFGRPHLAATVDSRFRQEDFTPIQGDLPIKPSPSNFPGSVERGIQPPHDIAARRVISTRPPRETALPWQNAATRTRLRAAPEPQIVQAPPHQTGSTAPLPRPPFGIPGAAARATAPSAETRPLSPNPGHTPAFLRSPTVQVSPTLAPMTVRPAPHAQTRAPTPPSGRQGSAKPLPGQPANQTYSPGNPNAPRWAR